MEIMFHNLEITTPLAILLLLLVLGGAIIIAHLRKKIVDFVLALFRNSGRDLQDSYSVSNESNGDIPSYNHYVIAMAMSSSIDLQGDIPVSSGGEHVHLGSFVGYGSDPLAVPPTPVNVMSADAVDRVTPVLALETLKSSFGASFPPTTELARDETDFIPVRSASDQRTGTNIRKRRTFSFERVGHITKRVKRSRLDLKQAGNIRKRTTSEFEAVSNIAKRLIDKKPRLDLKQAGNIRKRTTSDFEAASNTAKRLKRPPLDMKQVGHTDGVNHNSVQSLFRLHEEQSNTSTDVAASLRAARQGTHPVPDGKTFTVDLESGVPHLEGNYRLGTRTLLLWPAEWSLQKLKMILHRFNY